MHLLLQQYQHALLGRLRTKIFVAITGSNERLPTARQIWRWLMNEWKKNPELARIFLNIIHVRHLKQIVFPADMSRQQVRATMRNLAGQEGVFNFYAEGRLQGQHESKTVGCLVLGHTRLAGGTGYCAAIFNEDDFSSMEYVSIVPSDENGKTYIAAINGEEWDRLSVTEAGHRVGTRIAIATLNHIPNSQGIIQLPIEQTNIKPLNKSPEDPECTRRLKLVMRRKMSLTKAVVPCDAVLLFSPEYAKTLIKEHILALMETMKAEPLELLVYWNGTHFISSDDYYAYAAYGLLGLKCFNVVVMGEFPKNLVTIKSQGGRELLPPIGILEQKITPGVTDEFVAWQKKEEELNSKRLPPPSDLMVNWMQFAEMLAQANIKERELHSFLNDNPIVMGANWDTVESEVSFGGVFRADLVLRANRALPTVQLVELEKSTHRLFTQDLHETDEVTHAVQQVSDWLRWWRQNHGHAQVVASRGIDPSGLVVIGRSANLSERERETLAHNNQNRGIKVITYDELLDDFGTLILHRLDDTRS